MKNVKVKNMTNDIGRAIPNQFIIHTNKGNYFQSYNSIIAFIPHDWQKKTKLDKRYWDYSKTTGKYRNEFLGETIQETRIKIKAGEYILTDLNK